MIELFSCRNCIQNCGQSLNIGRGPGYCLQHNSVVVEPDRTTCKYLHRKDLPLFAVDEGAREHAAEFALFSGLVTLDTKTPLQRVPYSERFQWEHGSYDPVLHAIAQYFKIAPAWAFIQSFSGGLDGRRSLTHASFVRRYLSHCGTWVSSYRLILGLIQEVDSEPLFDKSSIVLMKGDDIKEAKADARWDVVFCRLSGIQEYGWHAGLEGLMWASDAVNGGLSNLDWTILKSEFEKIKPAWTDMVIGHARQENVFFQANREPHAYDEAEGAVDA
jgi:hypothetical protein